MLGGKPDDVGMRVARPSVLTGVEKVVFVACGGAVEGARVLESTGSSENMKFA